jgi:large repetitive protein
LFGGIIQPGLNIIPWCAFFTMFFGGGRSGGLLFIGSLIYLEEFGVMLSGMMRFFKRGFPVFMVLVLLAGFIPAGPVRAEENANTVVAEPEQGKKQESREQLVGETVAGGPLSWSALSLLDKNVMTTFYQTSKPNAKLSADERFVALNRNHLVSMDPPRIQEVITVYDRVTGETENIAGEDNQQIVSSRILDFDMSDDANYIAFSYGEGLFNEEMNVYLYDRTSKTLEKITSVSSRDVYGDDQNRVSISADGRYVAFDTDAKGLVAEDQDTFRDVFVYDRLATGQKLQRISARADLTQNDVGHSNAPSISGDGRYVAFQSRVNFTKDENETSSEDIYIYDRENTDTPFKKISVGLGGVDADGRSILPSISADGQSVAFLSDATNLVEGTDENYGDDLFVYNGASVKRVAFLPDVTDPEFLDQFKIKKPTISPDGKFVGYELHEETDEDTLINAYVASVESQTSTKVAVPQSTFKFENPNHSTVVGAGARTVIFYAMYERTFSGDITFAIPGPFIAAQGSNPTWAPGSKLQATEQSGSLTLTWPDAQDAGEILGYQIFQNDTVIGYVPFQEDNSFTVTGHDPSNPYHYQVEAVNSQFNVSYGGPKLITGSDTPTDPVVVLGWDADRTKNLLPLIGSTVTFNAYAKTGLQGEGTLTYKVSAAGGTTEVRTQTLNFAESSQGSGVYQSTFPVTEGIVELTSLVVKVVDPATQEEVSQQMAGMPIKIAGNVTFDFDNPGKANLKGAYLSIRGRYGGEFIVLNGEEPVTIEGLYPDEAYQATLYSSGGTRIYSQRENIKVSSGGKANISLQVIAPANIRFKMVDTKGAAIKNIGVQLYDSSQQYLGSYTSNEDGITGYFSHLTAGDQVTAKIDIGDHMYQKVPVQTITLVSGDQEKTITLTPIPVGVLEGTVTTTDNEPVMNAIVTMQQTVDGKSIVRTTYSSLNGRYKFEDVFEGDVSVEAIETSNKYKTEAPLTVKIEAEKTTDLPIMVSQPKTGIINVKVFLKYIDGEWMGPIDLSQMPFHTRIEYQGGGWQSGYYQNAYYYHGYPNRDVNVCVTTTTPNYTNKCVKVTVDSQGNATAELYFEEMGGRIQGTLALTDNYSVYGSLYHLDGIGSSWEQHVSSNEFRGNHFNINIMKPGRYRLDLVHMLPTGQQRYEYASVEFSVEEQKITQLGTIRFSPTSYFTNMEGNVFTAFPNRVFPGSTVDFRVSYKNVKNKEAKNASVIVSIPDGLVPIKDNNGKIIINGIQGEATLDGKNMMMNLGDLAPGQAGTISYKLKANQDFDGFNVRTAARIKATIDGASIDETLGTVFLETPKVTVEVQERLTSLQNELSGYAPAGSMVSVYDSNQLVGRTQASATGFWKANVVLPDLGNPSTHAIYAEATASSVKLRSETVYPDYNTTSPKLLEMAMAQAPDGKWVYLQVEKGISRIPYTVVPNNPFQFELKFDRPDDVENVYVYLGGQRGEAVKAVRDGNIYRAITPTGYDALGGIYVSYDEKPTPFTLDTNIPTLDEVRQSMPENMRDFEVVSTTAFELKDGKYSGQAKFKFPQLGNAIMTVTLSIKPNANYQPTAEEMAMAEKTQLPILNSSITETETEEAFTTVTEGYVPMELLFPNGLPNGQSTQAKAVSTTLAGGKFGWSAVGHLTTEATMEFTDVLKTGNDIRKSFNDQNDFAGRINKIMYKVQMGFDCLAEVPTTVREAGTALVAVVGGEVSKVALGAWAGAMGLTGAPGIAAAGAVYVAEQRIDAYVDSKIDAISSGYNECREDDKKRRKVAEPKWIYDPSGFVYEAVPANRLEGVKATVLYLDPDTNTWVVWDAGPYEQINPQLTNSEGKYGWDVPPGKWKVVWEKEGYETQSSAELDVPPPHTEVNAGLISRAAPQVDKVMGVQAATGSYVDVTFSKYLQVAANLPANAITVVDAAGKTIAGTARFVGEVDNPDAASPKQTRTVRFAVEGALDVAKQYEVKVNPSFFKSYADVWMKEAYAGSFTVVEEDLAGPIPVSANVIGLLLTIEFNEKLSTAAEAAKFVINNGLGAIVTSAVTDVNNRKVLYLSLNREIPAGTAVDVTLLAGAVSDEKGNLSAENQLTVTNQSPSDNALLAGLAVDSATLTPGFDPQVSSYTVQVANSATHLLVTAQAADPKAKLVIEGMEMVSGVAKSVLIPASGVISLSVTAENGTTRVYTIQVNRVVSNNANLSGLTITPGTLMPVFNGSQTLEYTVKVAKDVKELQITATAADGASSIVMNGVVITSGIGKTIAIPANGEIIIVVTAEDGTTKTYTTTVEATGSSEASLAALTVSPGTLAPAFHRDTLSYGVTVAAGVAELQVSATVTDADASLLINGEVVASGTAKSVTIPADGKIPVVVTAQDGTTKKEFTIQVNRQQNPGPVVDPDPIPVGDPLDLGKKAKVEKVKEADGGITVNIALLKETVELALKTKEAESKPLYVELKEQADQYVLQLSREIIELLQKGKADILVKTDIIQVAIPAQSIDISAVPEGSIVKIKIGKAVEKDKKAMFETAVVQSRGALKPVNEVISIGLEVQNVEKQTVPLSLPPKKGLLINWSTDATNKEALYQYDAAANTWSFAQSEPSMNLVSSGVFAVMAYENTFADVKNHWAKPEIEWMAQRLFINGYSKEEFKPNQQIARGEFTVILARALGLLGDVSGKPNTFTDVSPNSVYYAAVEAAVAAGIVKGKGNGTFAPNDPITREQMTIMIARAYVKLGLAGSNTADLTILEKFQDRNQISAGAVSEVALAVEEGLVKGRTDSQFDPKGLATRAHAVVMLKRMLERSDRVK